MHRTTVRHLATMLTVGGAVAVAAGCRGGGDEVVAGGATPVEVATTTTAAAPATTVAATTTSTARRAGAATTTTTVRSATTAAALPKVVVSQQGDRVVAVFVATGASLADPSFATAKSRLASLGYRGYSGGDTSCSQGAREALPQLQDHSLSLEFATTADAARFAARYGTVIGTATVTVFCAD